MSSLGLLPWCGVFPLWSCAISGLGLGLLAVVPSLIQTSTPLTSLLDPANKIVLPTGLGLHLLAMPALDALDALRLRLGPATTSCQAEAAAWGASLLKPVAAQVGAAAHGQLCCVVLCFFFVLCWHVFAGGAGGSVPAGFGSMRRRTIPCAPAHVFCAAQVAASFVRGWWATSGLSDDDVSATQNGHAMKAALALTGELWCHG